MADGWVALEFELAADLLNTAATPSWEDIGKLAAIAAFRTTLNYFLEREIQEESTPQQRQAEEITMGVRSGPQKAEPAKGVM